MPKKKKDEILKENTEVSKEFIWDSNSNSYIPLTNKLNKTSGKEKLEKPTPPPTKVLNEGENPKTIPNQIKNEIDKVEEVINMKLKDKMSSLFKKISGSLSIFKGVNPIFYLIFVILIGLVLYFTIFSSSGIRRENRELKKEVKNIQKERDLIRDSIVLLKDQYKKYEDSLAIRYEELSFINQRLSEIENRVYNSSSALNDTRKKLEIIRGEIKYKENNPSNRKGDSLINSLRRRLNK